MRNTVMVLILVLLIILASLIAYKQNAASATYRVEVNRLRKELKECGRKTETLRIEAAKERMMLEKVKTDAIRMEAEVKAKNKKK